MKKYIVRTIASVVAFTVLDTCITTAAGLANPLASAAPPTLREYSVALGVVVGSTYTIHSSGFASVMNDVLCPDFTGGKGLGYHVGLSSEWLITRNDWWNRSLIIRLQYNTLPARYEITGDTLPSISAGGNVIYSEVAHLADLTYSVLESVVLYKQNMFGTNLGIVIGPSVGYVTESHLEQRMVIVSPDSAVFERTEGLATTVEYTEDMRGIITAKSEMEDRYDIRLSASIGLQYEIFLDCLQIVPGIQYNVSLIQADKTTNLNINAFLASVDFRCTF